MAIYEINFRPFFVVADFQRPFSAFLIYHDLSVSFNVLRPSNKNAEMISIIDKRMKWEHSLEDCAIESNFCQVQKRKILLFIFKHCR